MMRLQRFTDAAAFLLRAEEWLLRAEAENNLILGLSRRHRTPRPGEAPIYLAVIEQHGTIKGCAFRTPPWKVGLTRMPTEAVKALVADLSEMYEEISGVLGPEEETRGFASLWSDLRGTPARLARRQAIYELERVTAPANRPGGRLRVATCDDLDLALDWGGAFVRETGVDNQNFGPAIEEKIGAGELWLWDDGQPRSMAARGSSTRNGSRVNWVFTPGEWRGRGYASACVAALSQAILDEGKRFCFLYTDLSNPTSNALYQRIGYEHVCDVVDYGFESIG
jgi:GNAT superfamily N-acetyltransferase